MKRIVTFWLVGCVLVGFDQYLTFQRCPSDNWPPIERMVGNVSIWPATLIASFGHDSPACQVLNAR